MYTDSTEFKDYFGLPEVPENYAMLEDLAIVILNDYCWSFPSVTQYNEMEEPTKGYVTKAIYFQIKHLIDNPNYVNGVDRVPNSIKLGRFQMDTNTQTTKETENGRYNDNAILFLDQSGVCSFAIGVDCGCPCDS